MSGLVHILKSGDLMVSERKIPQSDLLYVGVGIFDYFKGKLDANIGDTLREKSEPMMLFQEGPKTIEAAAKYLDGKAEGDRYFVPYHTKSGSPSIGYVTTFLLASKILPERIRIFSKEHFEHNREMPKEFQPIAEVFSSLNSQPKIMAGVWS